MPDPNSPFARDAENKLVRKSIGMICKTLRLYPYLKMALRSAYK